MLRSAQIIFPVGISSGFDYAVPPHMEGGQDLRPGSFVYAPLGKQAKLGVVLSVSDQPSERELKDILQVKPCLPLSRNMMKFIAFTARYNCAPIGMVLRMVLRSYQALEPSPDITRYRPSGSEPARMTPTRKAILDWQGPWPARASEVAAGAGVSPGAVSSLAKAGGLTALQEPLDPPFDTPQPDKDGLELTQGQKDAAAELVTLVKRGDFQAALLDGVTGSGKTEVYFEAVAEALRQGRQVLVLVPEIALTQAGMDRFKKRFGAEPAPWHSALGDAARRRTWREVYQGRAQLVVGARSALYLPYKKLGLIVVDEEHDSSYKQEEGVIYNARDMAVARGKIEGASVVLASATPSLESLTNARQGRYYHVILPERPGAVTLPDVELIDLKDHTPDKGRFISQPVIDAVRQSLSKGEQAMLYLNRRGYAPLIVCRHCGERLKSPDTDSWLVQHRRTGRAMCHHTGFSMPMPRECPKCHQEDSLAPVGPGVERVEEEAKAIWPNARIEIFSSDTAGNAEAIRARMERMARGEIDILVGTQMVVKGHNFPHLTTVGVIDGDLGLSGGDLRAGERTYQTLVQVAGRAGRAEKPGQALIQTHMPEHDALAALAAGDRERFISAELAMREALELPPYGRLAAVIISAPDGGQADKVARDFLLKAPRTDGVTILGPAEAPIAILRGRHRRRLLIQSGVSVNLPAYMAKWSASYRVPSKAKLHIDIDPQSFF